MAHAGNERRDGGFGGWWILNSTLIEEHLCLFEHAAFGRFFNFVVRVGILFRFQDVLRA